MVSICAKQFTNRWVLCSEGDIEFVFRIRKDQYISAVEYLVF